MSPEEARYLLGLTAEADAARVRAVYDIKRTELTERLANAPTEGLRAKYQMALGELVEAYELLSQPSTPTSPSSALSRTQMRDLPGAAPSFTQHGSGSGAAAVSLSVGEVLLNRYEVRALLGQGGMGAVYRAYDRTRAEEVALKVLLPELVSSEKAKERFLNEAKVTSRLSHPNIVRTYDIQQGEGLVFLTMELLEGETLRQRMERYKQARKQFSVEEVLEIIKPLIDALNYAHKTVIHRDLKPENIWLSSEGPVKLMDFGIARLFTQTDLTRTGMAIGSAYYMAPEQLAGEKHIDARADQYSLGVIMYEMFSGQVPVGAVRPLSTIRRDLSIAVSECVMKAMSPSANERFQNLPLFVDSFGNTKARGQQAPEDLRSRVRIAAFIAVLVLVGLVGANVVQTNVAAAERQRQQLLAEQNRQRLLEKVTRQKQEIERMATLYETESKALNWSFTWEDFNSGKSVKFVHGKAGRLFVNNLKGRAAALIPSMEEVSAASLPRLESIETMLSCYRQTTRTVLVTALMVRSAVRRNPNTDETTDEDFRNATRQLDDQGLRFEWLSDNLSCDRLIGYRVWSDAK